MKRFVFCLILLCTVSSGYASGQVGLTFSEYERAKDTVFFQAYVAAVGEGFLWANVDLLSRGQQPLFCAPLQTKLGGELFNAILTKRIKDHSLDIKPETPIGLILLSGLQESYPCTH